MLNITLFLLHGVAIVLLIASCTAASVKIPDITPACHVTDWQPWTGCARSSECRNTVNGFRVMSYGLQKAGHDAGREHMNILRQEKHRQWEASRKCKADGSCPELNDRKSTGKAFCKNGLAQDYPCRNMHMLSFVNFEDLGYGVPHPSDTNVKANDIWGWTDPMTNDEYAIVCLSGATSFVRITKPHKPETLAIMFTQTTATTWRDVKTIDNWAYVVSEAPGHGLQIFDLTRLRHMKGNGKKGPERVEPDQTYMEFGDAHNVVANEETGFLYVVGANKGEYKNNCDGGLHIVDVRDPMNPKFAGCYGGDGYTHDAQCVIYRGPDVAFFEHEICFCYNEDSLTIVDVSEHHNAKLVGKAGYLNSAYTHQGWLTDDQKLLVLDDELDEMNVDGITTTTTYVWDVTSLRAPALKSKYSSSETAIDHNLYIIGDLVYQSNYEAGLRILHLNQDTYELREVAYFDCLPSSTTANFHGTWSNYPYYKSGVVAMTSIDYGLFLVEPHMDDIRAEIDAGVSPTEHAHYRTITQSENGAQCPPLVETEQCEPITC